MSQNQNHNNQNNNNQGQGSKPISEQLQEITKVLSVKEKSVPVEFDDTEDDEMTATVDQILREADSEKDDYEESESEDEEYEEAEAESEDEDEEYSIASQPFAGLLKQSITVVVGLHSKDNVELADVNFNNPFSKKGGVARRFIEGISPFMTNLHNKNAILLTDSFNSGIESLLSVVIENSRNEISEIFGDAESEDFKVAVSIADSQDGVMPAINFDTCIYTSMSSLVSKKANAVVRNFVLYLRSLKDQLEGIDVTVVFGFNAEDLVDVDCKEAFDELREFVGDNNNTYLITKNKMNAFDKLPQERVESMFEEYDVLIAFC